MKYRMETRMEKRMEKRGNYVLQLFYTDGYFVNWLGSIRNSMFPLNTYFIS